MCCHFPKKRGGSLEGARVSPLTTYGTTLDRVGRGHPSCHCLSEIDQQEWTIDLPPQANTGLVEKEFHFVLVFVWLRPLSLEQ